MPVIKVICENGDTVEADLKILQRSDVIKTMYENLGDNEEEEGYELPINNVANGEVMKKILDWCSHYVDPKEDEFEEEDDKSDFDKNFFKIEDQTLINIIKAANFLDITDLLHNSSGECGRRLSLTPLDQLHSVLDELQIVNDLSELELEQIRKEDYWCNSGNRTEQ